MRWANHGQKRPHSTRTIYICSFIASAPILKGHRSHYLPHNLSRYSPLPLHNPRIQHLLVPKPDLIIYPQPPPPISHHGSQPRSLTPPIIPQPRNPPRPPLKHAPLLQRAPNLPDALQAHHPVRAGTGLPLLLLCAKHRDPAADPDLHVFPRPIPLGDPPRRARRGHAPSLESRRTRAAAASSGPFPPRSRLRSAFCSGHGHGGARPGFDRSVRRHQSWALLALAFVGRPGAGAGRADVFQGEQGEAEE